MTTPGRRQAPASRDPLDVVWLMASVLVPGKGASDRIGLGDVLGIAVAPEVPSGGAARAREAATVEAACRARLLRLDGTLLDQLHRILALGATCLGAIMDAALADRARAGLGGGGAPAGSVAPGPVAARDWSSRQGGGDDAPDALFHLPPLQPARERTPVDERDVIAALGPGGGVGRVLGGFEVRGGQVKMARAVTRAFNDGLRVLVEAGTGTGKSLAYLVPAAMHAVRNGRRVVISTHTIALQDQLVGKDIPVLRQALPHDVQVAVLKGRANYLCMRRWRTYLRASLVGEAERILAGRIAAWLAVTATGDRNELALDEVEAGIWNAHLAADVLHCTGRLCPENRAGRCWVARARRRANGAHLVVTNHALLLSDLATRQAAGGDGEGGILPDHAEAIIDEAHHLEAVATDHLGAEVSMRDLVGALQALSVPIGGARHGGSIARIGATYVEVGGQFARDTVQEIFNPVHDAVATAIQGVDPFREALLGVAGVGVEVRLVAEVRDGPAWVAACEAWERLAGALADVTRALRRVVEAFDPHVGTSEAVDDAVAEVVEAAAMVGETGAVVSRIIESPDPAEVSWIAVDAAAGGGARARSRGILAPGGPAPPRDVSLHAAPLEVNRHLQALLFEMLEGVVLTSATIAVDGSFRHARTRLGLGTQAHVLSVESPFDYPSQALLVIPRDLPDPASPAAAPLLHEILAGIGQAMGGRTLVLFTSHASLRGAHAYLREALPRLVVLGQGIDGSRTALLERFRATPTAILLGTSSFWEGIDVTGEALSCLVIQKLPFTPPGDPVFAARGELLADPFGELAVPQAVVRLRQGFGRLIRTTTDRGVAVVLDSRLVTRRYGRTFLGSMPPATVRTCLAREVVPVVAEWWGRSGQASTTGGAGHASPCP